MSEERQIAIVDYGMGNLFSVRQACEKSGMSAHITSQPTDLEAADGIILPGVGAFGDAMNTLDQLGLSDALRTQANQGKPLMGICLGMQLLMDESEEFGHHRGLGLIPGSVVRFQPMFDSGRAVKVPQVQWNQVFQRPLHSESIRPDWSTSPLEGLPDGSYMYFVHSYHVVPQDADVCLGTTQYGQTHYCSALLKDTIFACQFHPERSGPEGIRIYRNFSKSVQEFKSKREIYS